MGVIASLVVFTIGAVLRFATHFQSSTWDIRTIGDILMVVAVIGFLLAVFAWAYWDGFGGRMANRTTILSRPATPPVYGPQGYARTSYDGAIYGLDEAGVVEGMPAETVIEEERAL
ncbi:MAG TPA: hypothetical protein VG435_08555 [Acidimicrobiales bacterium]|jgi:hypothetical protein|nr:hypothetical protein [Acidimicrobiales bacterium]